jgi:hypothetical protein
MFRDYEARGAAFKAEVASLAEESGSAHGVAVAQRGDRTRPEGDRG